MSEPLSRELLASSATELVRALTDRKAGALEFMEAAISFSRHGLTIGAQLIGRYLGDRTTIAFGGRLEREFGGFRPPPALW